MRLGVLPLLFLFIGLLFFRYDKAYFLASCLVEAVCRVFIVIGLLFMIPNLAFWWMWEMVVIW